ncbi:MAG: hypothetical protein CVV11_08365 [Gammaproteobacteria bacterium HGW-Gammaproteobacteria-15]|nr:MAG: hypothetical protein CVV11_08365 [Gammaproteobacteria bacterium HGW-Gammaproteobacteria-15]
MLWFSLALSSGQSLIWIMFLQLGKPQPGARAQFYCSYYPIGSRAPGLLCDIENKKNRPLKTRGGTEEPTCSIGQGGTMREEKLNDGYNW